MTLLERDVPPPATPRPPGRGGERPQLSQIVRTWLGFAAIGAGMIHFALAVSAPVPLAIVLALLGLAEFAWGVLTFARDELILPRLARSVAVAPIIVWSLLVVASTLLDAPDIASSLALFPMATATAFELLVGTVLSRHLRRVDDAIRMDDDDRELALVSAAGGGGEPEPEPEPENSTTDAAAPAPAGPSAVRYLLALMIGALVVAALTTPALAATEAGRYAQPHGSHDAEFEPAPRESDQIGDVLEPGHGHD